MSKQVVYKTYNQDQLSLLPPSYDELVPKNHPVRVVNEILARVDISSLEKSYKGGGTSSYHPRMLLKVLIYAYLRNIYSSRKIEQALYENIHFMWLSGQSKPDHNTINDFRGKRLKGELKKIFSQVVILLSEAGHLSLKELYLDGTKLEANANRYTFVWGKSIKTSKSRIERQLKELWAYVENVYQQEEQEPNPPNFNQINSEKVEEAIDKINEALSNKKIDKKVRQKLNYAKKNWPGKLKKYEQQEKDLGGRNSMSKTDKDATFMRMKEDHMLDGQLKAGYNLQISTNSQYIANYTIAQKTTDTTTLVDHLENHQNHYLQLPDNITADAGYGSEENYEALEKRGIKAFVKFNYFHKERKEKKSGKFKQPFHVNNLYYNQQRDSYYCPIGQEMKKTGESQKRTSNGYLQHYSLYQAMNCKGCSLRSACHKAKGNRIVQRNHNLERHKAIARENLTSQDGIAHRKQRCWDVEAVFGNIKHNMNFKRFMLRGLEKVETEIGLIAMAHNLKKMSLSL